MNKNNIINRKYEINENVLKKASPNYKNVYSSYFNMETKERLTMFEDFKQNDVKKVK